MAEQFQMAGEKSAAMQFGKARAARHDKAILSKWANLGGRPPKKRKRNGN
jgi:hypothetical protein